MTTDSTPLPSPYSGTGTLEILGSAKNYNRHLLQLISTELSQLTKTQSPKTPPLTILDFGAGNGRFISSIDAPGAKLLAIEPDSTLGTSIKKFHDVQLVSLSSIPAGSVDFIYSLNVLEHIENDTETLVELSKKLRPGGRILIFVPAWPHLFSKFDEKIGHFRRYTRRGLKRKAEETRLTIESLFFFDPLGYFAALMFKVFSNKAVLPSRGLVAFDAVIYPASRLLFRITKNLIGKNLVMVIGRPNFTAST